MPEDDDGRTAMLQNLELKARYVDLAGARERVTGLGAQRVGRELQVDTYFGAPSGRLKIRESRGRRPLMIWYHRPDEAGIRRSDYRLTPVTDVARLKAALAAAMSVRGVVKKRRELLLWHNVRVHLDEVEGLGTFIEFEAVLTDEEPVEESQARLDRLCELLEIPAEDVVAGSYADLLGI